MVRMGWLAVEGENCGKLLSRPPPLQGCLAALLGREKVKDVPEVPGAKEGSGVLSPATSCWSKAEVGDKMAEEAEKRDKEAEVLASGESTGPVGVRARGTRRERVWREEEEGEGVREVGEFLMEAGLPTEAVREEAEDKFAAAAAEAEGEEAALRAYGLAGERDWEKAVRARLEARVKDTMGEGEGEKDEEGAEAAEAAKEGVRRWWAERGEAGDVNSEVTRGGVEVSEAAEACQADGEALSSLTGTASSLTQGELAEECGAERGTSTEAG